MSEQMYPMDAVVTIESESQNETAIFDQDETEEDGFPRPLESDEVDDTENERENERDASVPLQIEQVDDSEKEGCLTCREDVQLTSFFHNSLIPGHHICLRGKAPLIGGLYDHHAIVKNIENISEDGQTAEVTVIDVNQKRKHHFCLCENMRFQTHKLDIKGNTRIHCKHIVRIDYSKPWHDPSTTLQNAERAELNSSYCFFFNNCEHAVTACSAVDADSNEISLKRSTSLQLVFIIKLLLFLCSSTSFCWLVLGDLDLWTIQTLISIILYMLYNIIYFRVTVNTYFRSIKQCKPCTLYYKISSACFTLIPSMMSIIIVAIFAQPIHDRVKLIEQSGYIAAIIFVYFLFLIFYFVFTYHLTKYICYKISNIMGTLRPITPYWVLDTTNYRQNIFVYFDQWIHYH